jgi:hypothetical protein
VDWIAEDPYACCTGAVYRSDFAGMVDGCRIGRLQRRGSTPGRRQPIGKPVMLGEWGVDDVADDPGYKPEFFRTAASQLGLPSSRRCLLECGGLRLIGNTGRLLGGEPGRDQEVRLLDVLSIRDGTTCGDPGRGRQTAVPATRRSGIVRWRVVG